MGVVRWLLVLLFLIPILPAQADPAAVLDASPIVAEDWRRGYADQGHPDRVVVLITTEGETSLQQWATALGHGYFRPSQEVPAHVVHLPFSHVPDLVRLPGIKTLQFDYALEYHMASSSIEVQARAPAGIGGAYHFDDEGFVRPHDLTAPLTGKGVMVAVLDTGIDETHPDFGGFACQTPRGERACESRVVKKVKIDQFPYWLLNAGSNVPKTHAGDALPTTDWTNGHGTHVAGTIGGNGRMARDMPNPGDGADQITIGVAPEVEILSIGIGVGPSAGFASAAWGWLVDHYDEYPVSVVSNSYGCRDGCAYNPGFMDAFVRAVYEKGAVSVWSNGNSYGEGSGAEMNGDAQSPWVLGTAAYNDVTGQLASFSSRGKAGATLADPRTWTPEGEADNPPRRPDIAAPGVNTEAPTANTAGPRTYEYSGLDDRYISKSGTSMAAPHVSGAVALLTQACPTATPLDKMRAIKIGADPNGVLKTANGPGDVNTEAWSHGDGAADPFEAGYGALRVRASLDYLWDEVCPEHDLRSPIQGWDITPIAAQQFSRATIDVPDALAIRGLPEGLAFNASITGTPLHSGTYNLQVTTPDGTKWTQIIIAPSSLPNAVDPRDGVRGQADAFGLQELALPEAYGTAFLVEAAELSVHVAVCTTDCPAPGAGIPVGFTRGTGPDGKPAELRSQQSLPIGPDVRTITLGRGPVTLSLEAGAYVGGARIWIPDTGTFGYSPHPRLELPSLYWLGENGSADIPLTVIDGPAQLSLAEAPPGITLDGDVLRVRPTAALDAGVWINVTKDGRTQEQGLRIVASAVEVEAPVVAKKPEPVQVAPPVKVEPEPEPEPVEEPLASTPEPAPTKDSPLPLVLLLGALLLAARRR